MASLIDGRASGWKVLAGLKHASYAIVVAGYKEQKSVELCTSVM